MDTTAKDAMARELAARNALRLFSCHFVLLPNGPNRPRSSVDDPGLVAIWPDRVEDSLYDKVGSPLVRGRERDLFRLRELMEPGGNRSHGVEVSWFHLVRDVLEVTLRHLYEILQFTGDGSRIPGVRLFRSIWQIVCGEEPVSYAPGAAVERRRAFHHGRRILHAGIEAFSPSPLLEMAGARPLLLMFLQRKTMFAISLRKRPSGSWTPYSRGRITEEDIEKCFAVENPFYEVALHAYDRMSGISSPEPAGDGEAELDRLFLERLQREKVLTGFGAHKNFTIQLHGNGRGKSSIKLALSLGDRPFLQQVMREPTYVFWDLKRHPVRVFVEQPVDQELDVADLDSIRLHAESSHPSICRHAFVRRTVNYPHIGAICTERTKSRLLSLHRGDGRFDPSLFVLEQLRAAARILRYGVRRRDQAITQYNPFPRVNHEEYQAVVCGWDNALAMAKNHGAEIVTYDR